MNKTEAIEALVDSICTRTSLFAQELNKAVTNPKLKVISVHEFLLFLIHHIDKISFLKGFQPNGRMKMREEILRSLLNRDVLPTKTEEKLIEDSIKPSINAFGTSPSIAVEALLPSFHKEASDSDEYYSNCDTLIGKYPTDWKGLINKLIARISERAGEDEGIFSNILMTDIAVKAILYEDAVKKDNQALDVLKLNAQSEQINLNNLKVQFKGKPFNQLIKYHLKRQKNSRKLREATMGTMAMLPESAYKIAVDFIDRWNERVYDQSFWTKDTSEVFVEIVEDARLLLSSVGIPTDDETLFNMFQIVVLSYAYSASDQRKMRKFIGI